MVSKFLSLGSFLASDETDKSTVRALPGQWYTSEDPGFDKAENGLFPIHVHIDALADRADYNWRLAADNYNECYHCKTTHPDIPDAVDLASYSVDVQRAWFHHNGSTEREVTPEQKEKGLLVWSSYY
ncbi:hypothetical protein ACJ41O_014475 [Fusarium nematophilum]